MQESGYDEKLISAEEARAQGESVKYPALENELREARVTINDLVRKAAAILNCQGCELPKMSAQCFTAIKSELVANGYKVCASPYGYSDGTKMYYIDWSQE